MPPVTIWCVRPSPDLRDAIAAPVRYPDVGPVEGYRIETDDGSPAVGAPTLPSEAFSFVTLPLYLHSLCSMRSSGWSRIIITHRRRKLPSPLPSRTDMLLLPMLAVAISRALSPFTRAKRLQLLPVEGYRGV